MLDELHVSNMALIESASIQPSDSLTVLTGETGAGKTALLESCKLLMGERADKSIVREGANEACVQGRFFIENRFTLDGNDEYMEALDETVASRRLSADGRSRVQINGAMVSVSELADVIGPTIDLCSQHDSQSLLRTATHEEMLKLWAANSAGNTFQEYEKAYSEYDVLQQKLTEIKQASSLSADQLERDRFVLRQIEAVGPNEDEYKELISSLSKAENSEVLVRSTNTAYESIAGEGGAIDGVNSAIAALEEGARFEDGIGVYSETLREALYILEDVSRDTLRYRDNVEFQPDELAQMQERASSYQTLLHSYGPEISDVLNTENEVRQRISVSGDSKQLIEETKKKLLDAQENLQGAASTYLSVLQDAAPAFVDGVTEVMHRLEMGTAELVCKIEMLPFESWTQRGPVKVELLFRPAQNMQPRPLNRIASGGELSRVTLAFRVAMREYDEKKTLIFDEIDAGVGGSTAIAIAELLDELSEHQQVIVVTHLAQVAARAKKHYVVRKSEEDGVARTNLVEVDGEERVGEIARMLSGTATEASLAHARELLSKV